MARFAVSVVTCRQAETRMPLSGWFLMNSLRMLCSTGIDWLAHSMRRFPRSASSRFLISNEVCVTVVVAMFSYFAALLGKTEILAVHPVGLSGVEQAFRPA